MSAPYIYTYSPSNVIFTFGGYTTLGWERITIEKNSTRTRQIRGIRGKNTKIRNKDTSCRISLEVAQSSETNLVLTRALDFDSRTGNLRFEVVLKETGGGSVFQSNEAYLEGDPKVTYSGSLETRTWVFICDSSNWELRGNVANSNSLLEKAKEKFNEIF